MNQELKELVLSNLFHGNKYYKNNPLGYDIVDERDFFDCDSKDIRVKCPKNHVFAGSLFNPKYLACEQCDQELLDFYYVTFGKHTKRTSAFHLTNFDKVCTLYLKKFTKDTLVEALNSLKAFVFYIPVRLYDEDVREFFRDFSLKDIEDVLRITDIKFSYNARDKYHQLNLTKEKSVVLSKVVDSKTEIQENIFQNLDVVEHLSKYLKVTDLINLKKSEISLDKNSMNELIEKKIKSIESNLFEILELFLCRPKLASRHYDFTKITEKIFTRQISAIKFPEFLRQMSMFSLYQNKGLNSVDDSYYETEKKAYYLFKKIVMKKPKFLNPTVISIRINAFFMEDYEFWIRNFPGFMFDFDKYPNGFAILKQKIGQHNFEEYYKLLRKEQRK